MKKKERIQIIDGVFTGNARGFGFVTPGGTKAADIFVPEKYTNGALHGDTVQVRVTPNANGDSHTGDSQRTEGQIVRILRRGGERLVGTFYTDGTGGFIIPLENKIPYRFTITVSEQKQWRLADGYRVMFSPDMSRPNSPHAAISERLGHMNEPGVDVLSIVRQYGVPYEFPQKVLDDAASLPDTVLEQELEGRLDLRDTPIITIDGEDTKDIDDAVSLTVTPDGLYELGVHIADVSHYVRAETSIDTEALRRGTSIYPADRVIPMLPQVLSNGICSLFPGVDRLTLSCLMTVDTEGRVVSHRIAPSVINSNRRFTYERVSGLLSGDTPGDDEPWLPLLTKMDELRRILWDKRSRRGALAFDFPESKIRVDENGWPVSITPYERNAATGLIEEFMILCNETVAEHFFWLETPFVYRTHEEPEQEKIRQLAVFVRDFGYKLHGNAQTAGVLQRLLAQTEGKPEEAVIGQAVLRSLKQARYTPDNLGHYGLASKYYCHFTSPIRRYPDLQIHRIIKAALAGSGTEETADFRGILSEVCKACSKAERTAEALEREVAQLKKVQYMLDKEGRLFDAIISGITPWGVYAALSNTAEGLLPINHLRSVHFKYDEKNQCYVKQRTSRQQEITLRVGGRVRVMLDRAVVEERKLYFLLADDSLYI